MKKLSHAVFFALATTLFAQSWPVATPPRPAAPDRAELAPDQINSDMPVNHAKLIWFVSAREIVRGNEKELGKVALGKMLDQDIASPTVLEKPRVYEVVLDLQRTIQVDRINIVMDNPGCGISLKTSDADLSRNEGEAWQNVGATTSKVPVTIFNMRMEPVRFIRVSIDTTSATVKAPVNIYEVAVFGQEDIRDYVLNLTPEKERKSRTEFVETATGGVYPDEMLQNDLASLDAGSKVTYVSSKLDDPNVSYMIDDDAETRWTSDKSEKETVIVIDLGAERRVNRMSIMHSSRPGKMMVYFLDELPFKQATASLGELAELGRRDATLTDVPVLRLVQAAAAAGPNTKTLNLAGTWLDKQTPFGSFDTATSNFSSVATDVASKGRYVLLRYINGEPGVGEPLLINAVNVFGDYGPGDLVLMPRNLPIIAAGGLNMGPPDGSTIGLDINDQLHPVTPPEPTPATP
jgi:hypothetical protein